jgi:hypothetical protein
MRTGYRTLKMREGNADSGWVLENTQSINAFGQITGQGFIKVNITPLF